MLKINFAVVLMVLATCAQGQNFAVVNGKSLPYKTLETETRKSMQENKSSDAFATRDSVRYALISMELLYQEAERLGYASDKTVLAAARKRADAEKLAIEVKLLKESFFPIDPLSESELGAEVAKTNLKPYPARQDYKVEMLTVDESEKQNALTLLEGGLPIDEVVDETDGTVVYPNSEWEWVKSSDFKTDVAHVLKNLKKGGVSAIRNEVEPGSPQSYSIIRKVDERAGNAARDKSTQLIVAMLPLREKAHGLAIVEALMAKATVSRRGQAISVDGIPITAAFYDAVVTARLEDADRKAAGRSYDRKSLEEAYVKQMIEAELVRQAVGRFTPSLQAEAKRRVEANYKERLRAEAVEKFTADHVPKTPGASKNEKFMNMLKTLRNKASITDIW